jgi:hypothetical protein
MGRGWKGGGQFTSNLGPRWMGSYHDKEGLQVSEREVGLKQQGTGKGSKRQRGLRYKYVVNLYNVCFNCLNVECS